MLKEIKERRMLFTITEPFNNKYT